MIKLPFRIIKEQFTSVHAIRWAIYGHAKHDKQFRLSDVRDQCFDNSFSERRIKELIKPVTNIIIVDGIIKSSYMVNQYSFCDYAKIMKLCSISSAKAYMCAQCNMKLNMEQAKHIMQCKDDRTVINSLKNAKVNYEYAENTFHLHQDGINLKEKLNYISKRNLEFLKYGSNAVVLKDAFWEAQRCFSRCSGNCAVNNFKLATTSKKLHSGTAYEYIDQDRPCTYCRKFQDSPVAEWLRPIWEKYPVKNVKEFRR